MLEVVAAVAQVELHDAAVEVFAAAAGVADIVLAVVSFVVDSAVSYSLDSFLVAYCWFELDLDYCVVYTPSVAVDDLY